MPVSNEHRIVSELALLYLRDMWSVWPAAVEPQGLDHRNYDALGIRSTPKSIVGIEVKVTRSDFLAGINKGHFNKVDTINELWLAYTGKFDIKELPKYVGILKLETKPKCSFHMELDEICGYDCKNRKNIFFKVKRRAQYWHSEEEQKKYFNLYMPKWLWKIAVSNTTKLYNHISYNVLGDEEINYVNEEDKKPRKKKDKNEK